MLRRSPALFNVANAFRTLGSHTAPTPPKHLDKPGLWSATQGPYKDTAGRRARHLHIKVMGNIGKLTKPFRTVKTKIMWRKFTNRVFKSTVGILVFLTLCVWVVTMVTVVFYAQAKAGPSTPQLERKAREHRLSRQIIQMVREREREIHDEHDILEVAGNVERTKQLAAKA